MKARTTKNQLIRYRMFKLSIVIASLALLGSCNSNAEGTLNHEELISLNGERIYINSLNWGVTDDSQITLITDRSENIKSTDTIESIKGLEPFIYKFEKDTLNLYFKDSVTYKVNKEFNYIRIAYHKLNAKKYNEIYKKAMQNDEFHAIPKRVKTDYPADMPKGPRK
ncbi:hypothetical protein FNO01nite_34100 [Flavobacterium noncentrifugens]|nr:hypothetical protein FNO01nite_34100 [Flavobacterium noncentrifugens]